MRIIAGSLARRSLVAPAGRTTRPTSDRVREALFQHLESSRLAGGFAGLTVLDLYAGSGALAFEAMSRGARQATLVDRDRAAIAAQKRNAADLGVDVRLILGELPAAVRRIGGPPADVVFVDPPYSLDPLAAVVALLLEHDRLSPDALVVHEHSGSYSPLPLDGFDVPQTRRYGDTAITFHHRRAPS